MTSANHRRRPVAFVAWASIAALSGVGLCLALVPLLGVFVLLLCQLLPSPVVMASAASIVAALTIRGIVRFVNRRDDPRGAQRGNDERRNPIVE